MKVPSLVRLFAVLTLVAGLASCASPMIMESVSDPMNSTSLQRVLIVSNGELFPEGTREFLFRPSLDVVRQLFSRHGVVSSLVNIQKDDLNPSLELSAAARDLSATHVLYITVTKVTSFGPSRPESDPLNQLRLVTDFTYSLQIADLRKRKNIWKGELRSGSGSTEDSLRQIEERLKEHLYRARLLKPLA